MSFARPLYLLLSLGFVTLGLDAPAMADPAPAMPRQVEAAIAAIPALDAKGEERVVREFYRSRGHRPAWSNGPTPDDIKAVTAASGLDARAYPVPTRRDDIDSDIAVSLTLLRLGRDLTSGRVAPDRALGGSGIRGGGGFDGPRFLRGLADGRPLSDMVATAAQPPFVSYLALKEALERTRAAARAGGWPSVPDGPKLVPLESVDDRLPALRRRLIATGELDPALAEGTAFDAPVVEAVRRFQRRHGLEPDGTVGARTLAALNVSAEARARQIALNMERWRWMPHRLGRVHISVNIPAATLELVDDGAVVKTMRVVVGDTRHPTPSMTTSVSSMVLNPPWSVPSSIASNEILPKLRRDPNYLANNNFQIADYPEDSPEAAGDGIDWNAIGKKFPYRLRQPPGPDNALGQIKFNLHDSDDIYLHDTPSRRAFSRAHRALSHGCVRLEEPVALAEALLGSAWRDRLGATLASDRRTRTLKLERDIPVYLVYFTAWVGADGEIQFRDDLYGHDRRLAQALDRARRPAPSPPPAAPNSAAAPSPAARALPPAPDVRQSAANPG